VSHRAIAAVLARTDLAMGERLVALSLASFANREEPAFPRNAAAAARAGLGRSRYLEAREQLVARGLVAIEEAGRGRSQATTLIALFAQSGPWWDGEINAGLLEQVLSHSVVRGAARLLLATLAALADESGVVDELSTGELSRAAGLANSTYRRARNALLASGEVELVDDGGGRGRVNRWRVLVAASGLTPSSARPRRRGAPPARPAAAPHDSAIGANDSHRGCNSRRRCTCARREGSGTERGFGSKGSGPERGYRTKGSGPERGIAAKGPDASGVYRANPAKTPPETPPPHARAGNEPLNPRTRNPPTP
jgi:hypothetical protein